MSNFRQTIALLPLVFLGAACGAGAEGEVRGTIHAPPGEEIQGALVIACHVVEGACSTESPQTQAVRIATPGASAPYVIQGLAPGEYHMVGLFDVNGNNVEDAGDWTGHHARADGSPQPVTPPATGVDIRLSATEYAPARVYPAEPSVPRPSPATHAAVPPSRTLSPAQRLSGIYHGVTRNLVAPGPGSPVQSGITWTPGRDWITFFPDGRAYHALPPEGLKEPFDWNLLCGINPTWCTTYEVRGNEIRARWDTGFEKVFSRESDGMLWTEERLNYLELPPLDGLRLEGRYASVANPYRTGWIRFASDGSFAEQRFLNDTNWREMGSSRQLTEAEVAGGTGTYTIRANTLELRYRDGRVVRMVVYAFPEEAARQRPQVLYFNAWDYHLER